MRRLLASLALVTSVLVPGVARADGAADLVGTWKRDDGKLYRLDLESQSGELVGKALNPPAADDEGKRFYSVDLHLKVEGQKVEGKAVWIEPNPKKGQPGQPESWSANARWELTLTEPGKLKGKTEWLEWAAGVVSDRGFDEHSFTRLPVVTLGGTGTAPDKVEGGQPINAAALAGTWKTSTGAYVTVKQAEAGFLVERLSGEGAFPQSIKLVNDANVLRGMAAWADGAETNVELKLAAPGRLEGRTERLEGEKDHYEKSWAPWALDRLARVDATTAEATGEAAALAPGATAELPLDMKREDGLYLKLERKEDGSYSGELVSKADGSRAKIELSPAGENRYAGKATFTVDGSPVELKWEIAAAEGGAVARCEWVDWDPAAKTAPVRGTVTRKFKALRRVG